MSYRLTNQRAIIDRRAIADRIAVEAEQLGHDGAKLRPRIVAILKEALEAGRKDAARRLAAHPTRGRETVS
ncbi:MAG TPA: hypothetical protein VL918_13055, partial [Sphingobium sp.]|nr:hypothetical protein [Sphingobium sp.]